MYLLPLCFNIFPSIRFVEEKNEKKMAMGFLNNKLFSSFGQYPITKEFSNQRITPIRKFDLVFIPFSSF
ncbi:hypothetical protein KEM48_010834 [Puccinia striiformis f. sp. tritici PST-130]|nr:hypothetical protein KEM48_010834 [Puccinia striiformis f. sp. tritici PST-130]